MNRRTAIKLTVVIVSYNCKEYMLGCVQSLYEARIPFSTEIVVVDNASTDDGPDLLAARYPQVKIIRNLENVGFARANNQAIRDSTGEYVLLLNNDTVVRPGTVEAMVERLDSEPTTGAVGCALEDTNGDLQVSFGGMLSFRNEFYQKYLSRHLWHWRQRLFGLRVSYPHWVSGAFLLARRTVLMQVGLLDENFFMYTEEVDLCERIRRDGYRICFDPRWRIIHYGGKSTEENRLKAGIEYRRSQLYFYSKHYGARRARLLRWYLLMKAALGLIISRLRRDAPSKIDLRRRIFVTVRDYRLNASPGEDSR